MFVPQHPGCEKNEDAATILSPPRPGDRF